MLMELDFVPYDFLVIWSSGNIAFNMADVHHRRIAQKLKVACEETAAQAIEATSASGQASRIHGKNRKFGSRKEAMAAKIEAAKAKREAKGADISQGPPVKLSRQEAK